MPGDPDRVARGAAPAERAGHQDVQVASTAKSIARRTLYSRSRRPATVAVATYGISWQRHNGQDLFPAAVTDGPWRGRAQAPGRRRR